MLIPGGSAAKLHEFIKKKKNKMDSSGSVPPPRGMKSSSSCTEQKSSARWGESWLTFGGEELLDARTSHCAQGVVDIAVSPCADVHALSRFQAQPSFTRVGCSVLSFPLYLRFPTFPTIDVYAAETVKAYPLHTNWSPDFQRNCRLCILTDWRDNWK